MPKKFLRVDAGKISRLGRKRPKLLKWRRPRGKQNKIRLGRAGYPVAPSVGFRTPRKLSGKVGGLVPSLVHNVREIEALGRDKIAIIARVGAKKKMEMLRKAEEKKIKILNLGGKK
jgi:large subunit ribosomal protein L32e